MTKVQKPLNSYDIALAAQIVEDSYDYFKRNRHSTLRKDVLVALDDRGVQALFLKQQILVIPGSNSLLDYARFNLRPLGLARKTYSVDSTIVESSNGVRWHQGFLHFTYILQNWMKQKGLKPKYIMGHSLGGAATQILVASTGVPGIAFASPRTLGQDVSWRHNARCLCINRQDDTVTELPSSFWHIGRVFTAKPRGVNFGLDHKMKHYRKVIKAEQAKNRLGKRWPA